MNQLLYRMRIIMFLVILAANTGISVVQYCEKNNEEPWSYHGSNNGPEWWSKLFPSCGGKQQSPIRILEDRIVNDRSLSKLRFKHYEIPIDRAEIVNNGHTVIITPRDGIRRNVFIEGTEFTLQQMHFHWGSIEKPGAEHTINHIRYPMEVHFVHRNSENKTAVVALLVEVREHSWMTQPHIGHYVDYNDAFTPIIEALPEVMYKNKSTQLLFLLNLNDLLPENPASFYRYVGSLTTPPCDEGVIWSILRKTTYIAGHQLNFFLNLYSVPKASKGQECRLSENYRLSFISREVSASR